jgi:probable F420-dependent oxidoreductase
LNRELKVQIVNTRPERPIRLAVQIAPQHAGYSTIRGVIAELEDIGVDVVFNQDHFFAMTGDPHDEVFEAWSMIAAVAEQTSRVEFGILVSGNGYRNPNLQADMARTIDNISAHGTGVGRFIFGTGSGWFEPDYTEYGYEFGTVGTRLDDLARDLVIVEDRWTKVNPPPTRKIPVLIGGGGERKTLRIVAQHADIWHSFSDSETLMRKLGILAEHGREVGRDIGEIEISADLRGKSIAEVDQLFDLGATLFNTGIDGPDFDISEVRKWLTWRDERRSSRQ